MADISLIDPYSAQQEGIARQRRMAQALQQQAQAPMEMPQTPGVLISPYAGLAKVLQGAYGGYQEAEADKEYRNLVNEARTTQAEDFAKVIGALKAPGQEAIVGQDAVDFVPGSYTPERTSLRNYAETTIPAEFTPTIPGRPAIAAQPAREAGYIGPDLIASLKDPSMRQFAMAHAMAKLEPKAPISVAAGGTLLDSRTFKPVFTADAAPQRPVALSPGQELRGPTGNLLATAAAKTEATALSPLGKLQSERAAIFATNSKDPRLVTYDKAITKESEDQRLVFDQVKFEYEKGNPGFTLERIKNSDGSESVMAVNKGSAVARAVVGADGKALTSAAPKITPHYSEVEDKGNVVIVDLSLPAEDRLAKGQIKAPIRNNLEKITTTDASGREVSRYVDKGTLATLGDIPAPYKGFMSDLAETGQLPANWQSIPQIAGLVRENLINKAGGITQADLANLKVRIAEAAAKLAYEGVPGFSAAGLTPALPNFTTLPSQYPTASGAPAAAGSKITTRAEIADAAKRSGKSIDEVTRDAVAKGYKVQ
jgi:hypothetical protein